MQENLSIGSRARLNNGVKIPLVGFGTYKLKPGKEARQAVGWALEAGYRHVDTAAFYGNEADVGSALRESGLAREEVFVTTKLWNSDQHRPRQAFEESAKKLGLGAVDLYLIHWPAPQTRKAAWKSLEKGYKEGKAHAIGVSNYTVAHLEELLADCNVVPAVNQVEFSPFLYQKGLLDYCRKKGIALEAYSPLTRGRMLSHPGIAQIGADHKKTAAQVLIRWSLQRGCITLPKSANRERITENADVFGFALTEQEMGKLDSLNEGYRIAWDPSKLP